MSQGGYDYHHATSGHQFLAIVVILAIILIIGASLGLVLLTSIL